MHLQLLVQHVVLASEVKSLSKNKDIARKRIVSRISDLICNKIKNLGYCYELNRPIRKCSMFQMELEELCSQSSTDGLLQAMQGESDVPKSIFKCLEIYPALKLADREKPAPDVTPKQPIPTKIAKGRDIEILT